LEWLGGLREKEKKLIRETRNFARVILFISLLEMIFPKELFIVSKNNDTR
jgi:hypothetical protein